ncbi:MAG: hypothetical protein GVY07_08495 [Bacteroidetes bacterium]|jgi:hypothetical protein|nr:hypothetical protein [Bacteroidota bacterium]
MTHSIKTVTFLLLFASALLAGCDVTSTSDSSPSEVQVQMQVNTGQTTAKSSASGSANQASAIINSVKLYIDEMELESTGEDSLDFEIEDVIVDLPLDGSPLVLTQQLIPSGLYDEFELEVETPDEEVPVNDTDFRDSTGDYSVVVRGTFSGEDFMFRSEEDFELELDLNPALEITENDGSTLVVNVNVSDWFTGSAGEDLDPNDPSNLEQINENIEASFDGFEDDDDDDDSDDDDDNDDDDSDD